MRIVLSLVMVAITVFAGGWVYAKYNLLGRVSALSRQSNALCNQRGTGGLNREAALARFKALADSLNLEVSEAAISIEPVDKASPGGGMGAAMQTALSGMTSGKISMKASMVKVTARIQGEKWLWSVEKTVESSCVLAGKIELREDRQVRDAANQARDRSRSIMGNR